MEDLQDKIIELMDLFDDEQVTTADKIDRPQRALDREAFDDFMKRNPMAGGGMLVQPSADGRRPGYKEDNVGGKVAAKEVKDFKTNINNWTKNWIKENINNYNIRQSDKFINDLKKAWTKESKNKKYKVVGVDSAKSRVLTQNGFPAVSTNKAVNSFNIFGYEMPGGIKTENIGNAQRNLYSKIFFTNALKNNPQLNKKLNFYFDYITVDKRGTNASSLSKKVTNIMAKAGVTDPKELLDKDVMYLLSKDSGMGDKARYEFFVNNYGNKYINYRNKVDTMHGDYIKNVRILKDKFNINVKSQLNKENNALKKIFDVNDLPFELRYSGDHLFGVSQAAKSNNKKFAVQAVNNLVGMTREQNKILGLGEFERTRKDLISKINTAKVGNKTKLLTELNNLMKDTYQDFFGKKQNYYSLDKGKVTISKDFVPLSQEERFANYFKQIDKTKEGRAAIKKQAGSLENLLASFGDGNCPVNFGKNKRDGGRIGYQVGTIDKKRCIDQGVKNFNEGRFKTADQVQDAAKLLSGGRRVLSGLMKYGIIPELAFVGLEATGRSILGEKPLNAIKKSIDTFTFGLTDFTSGIEAEKFGKDADLKLSVDKFRASQNKVNSIEQEIANLESLNTGSQFGYEGDQTEAIQMKKAQLEAAKKELEQNYVNPDMVQYIDRKGENIADAQMAKSGYAKASLKDQMEGIPGVADYMDTETARVFPRQPSQVELNLNMLPSFQDYQKSDQGQIDRTILNAPDEVLQEISPDALDLKKALQEEYKMENLKNTFGAEQIYGTRGVFSQPLAGGGIAKMAGVDQGPPPESGPNPQGLQGLMKRVKNI